MPYYFVATVFLLGFGIILKQASIIAKKRRTYTLPCGCRHK